MLGARLRSAAGSRLEDEGGEVPAGYYSNSMSGNIQASYPAVNGFDGDLDTRLGGTGTLVFAPPEPITYSTSVEVYGFENGYDEVKINNGSFVRNTSGSTLQWVTIASGSGSISSMTFRDYRGSFYGVGFNAIRVDGNILTEGA